MCLYQRDRYTCGHPPSSPHQVKACEMTFGNVHEDIIDNVQVNHECPSCTTRRGFTSTGWSNPGVAWHKSPWLYMSAEEQREARKSVDLDAICKPLEEEERRRSEILEDWERGRERERQEAVEARLVADDANTELAKACEHGDSLWHCKKCYDDLAQAAAKSPGKVEEASGAEDEP